MAYRLYSQFNPQRCCILHGSSERVVQRHIFFGSLHQNLVVSGVHFWFKITLKVSIVYKQIFAASKCQLNCFPLFIIIIIINNNNNNIIIIITGLHL